MTRFGTLLGATALTLAFGASAVLAQAPATTTTPAGATAAKKAPVKLKTATTAVGKECSAQADAKGLHGKERRKFRATCKKNAGKS